MSSTSSSPTHTSTFSGPPRPATPTLPADVPTTGPNAAKGEKPPIMPLEATQHTSRGAQAFAAFFVKTIDWGYATTSSAYMRHYMSVSCVGCASTAIALDKAKRQGHRFIGDRFTIKSAVPLKTTSPDRPALLVTFDVNSSEVVDKHGKFVDAGPALPGFRERIDLRWGNGVWTVYEFTASPK